MTHAGLHPGEIEVQGALTEAAQATKDTIQKFHQAFDDHDPDAMESLVADDCVIENTAPAPNGSRHVGKQQCLAVWQGIARSGGSWFEREEVFVVGERVIIRWRYHWGKSAAESVRGINLMRVRGRRIVEAMGYVKSE